MKKKRPKETCLRCAEALPAKAFYPVEKRLEGYERYCRDCTTDVWLQRNDKRGTRGRSGAQPRAA